MGSRDKEPQLSMASQINQKPGSVWGFVSQNEMDNNREKYPALFCGLLMHTCTLMHAHTHEELEVDIDMFRENTI